MTKRIKCSVEEIEAKGLAILRIDTAALLQADRQDFRRAARALAGSEMPRLVVDLSGISRLMSVFIGELVYLAERVRNDGKKLSVIAPRHIADLFEMTGTKDIFALHVVGEK